MPPQPLLPRRRQWPDPLSDSDATGRGQARAGPSRLGIVGAVWQCTLCLALFSSFYAAKMHLVKTNKRSRAEPGPATAAAAASSPPSRNCFQSAVDIAKQKNRETGRIFSPAEVAIVKHSLSSDSLARSRLAGGTASLDCREGGELLEMARNQRVLELQNHVRAFDNHRNKF